MLRLLPRRSINFTYTFRYLTTQVKANIIPLFEPETNTAQYILSCPITKEAAIIDSVLDYNPFHAITSTKTADKLLEIVKENSLNVNWILETHVHADHITAATYLKQKLNSRPKIGISKNVTKVQKVFAPKYQVNIPTDGSQFDILFEDGQTFQLGNLTVQIIYTPGHTPACLCYYIENDSIFVGDTFFMPDSGTARCDFPGGSAETLWESLNKITSKDDNVRVFVGHDYKGTGGRDFKWETTIKELKEQNIHFANANKESYIGMRTKRDATLSAPRLIHPALQLNLSAGNPISVDFVRLPLKADWFNKQ